MAFSTRGTLQRLLSLSAPVWCFLSANRAAAVSTGGRGGAIKAASSSSRSGSLPRLIKLLETMHDDMDKEQKAEEAAFKKKQCWCDQTIEETKGSIDSNQNRVAEISATIKENVGTIGTLKAELSPTSSPLIRKISEQTSAVETAKIMREKERTENGEAIKQAKIALRDVESALVVLNSPGVVAANKEALLQQSGNGRAGAAPSSEEELSGAVLMALQTVLQHTGKLAFVKSVDVENADHDLVSVSAPSFLQLHTTAAAEAAVAARAARMMRAASSLDRALEDGYGLQATAPEVTLTPSLARKIIQQWIATHSAGSNGGHGTVVKEVVFTQQEQLQGSSSSSASYTAKSPLARVIGVLKHMKQNFAQTAEALADAETAADAEHKDWLKTISKELKAAKTQKNEKTEKLNAAKIVVEDLTEERGKLEKQTNEILEKLLADTVEECADAKKEYDSVTAARLEEMKGLEEARGILVKFVEEGAMEAAGAEKSLLAFSTSFLQEVQVQNQKQKDEQADDDLEAAYESEVDSKVTVGNELLPGLLEVDGDESRRSTSTKPLPPINAASASERKSEQPARKAQLLIQNVQSWATAGEENVVTRSTAHAQRQMPRPRPAPTSLLQDHEAGAEFSPASSGAPPVFKQLAGKIDILVSSLNSAQAQDNTHRDACVSDLKRGSEKIALLGRELAVLASTADSKAEKIRKLTDRLNQTKTVELADIEQNRDVASQEREEENKNFQRDVKEQCATVKVLKMALGKLAGGAGGAVKAIFNKLIREAGAEEAELLRAESLAQAEYVQVAKDLNLAEEKAMEKVEKLKKDLGAVKAEVAALALKTKETSVVKSDHEKTQEGRREECEFLLKHYETRQKERGMEKGKLLKVQGFFGGKTEK